jgi:hypothetical protein
MFDGQKLRFSAEGKQAVFDGIGQQFNDSLLLEAVVNPQDYQAGGNTEGDHSQ